MSVFGFPVQHASWLWV